MFPQIGFCSAITVATDCFANYYQNYGKWRNASKFWLTVLLSLGAQLKWVLSTSTHSAFHPDQSANSADNLENEECTVKNCDYNLIQIFSPVSQIKFMYSNSLMMWSFLFSALLQVLQQRNEAENLTGKIFLLYLSLLLYQKNPAMHWVKENSIEKKIK